MCEIQQDIQKVPHVTKADIIAGLQELGLKPGSGVMVHSSLKSFGVVEGGPMTVIQALMKVLTPEGTLMMPSFNQGFIFRKGREVVFDVTKTPTINGAIPDLFWRIPGVRRSLHPTHSFAAWGKNADRYTRFHHRTLSMGLESPLGLLYQDDGYVLLMGVDYTTNTFHHVVETITGVPCLGRRTEVYPMILRDGRRVEGRSWSYRSRGCKLTDWAMYGKDMESRGLHKVIFVGNSRFIFFRLKDCFNVISDVLREGRCGVLPCSQCSTKPYIYQEGVVSDWDDEKQCLKPDSAAWDY